MGKSEIVIRNRRAKHFFSIVDSIETGIVLRGTEVKSIRDGKANLRNSFARVEEGEVLLYNFHIDFYQQVTHFGHDPERPKKLLLHKNQIKRLVGKVQEKGVTLIPLKIYFRNGIVKVELALAKGKKKYDRRRDIAEREAKREMERILKR